MNFKIKEGDSKNILIDNFESINFELGSNSSLILKYVLFNKSKDININGKLNRNTNLKVIFADFSNGVSKIHAKIELNGEKSSAKWDLASLASMKDKKIYDISFIHNIGTTIADMNNYGVTLNSSRIEFSGTNHIKKNAKKSKTNQNAKIIVFDNNSSGKANPILRIDENDVLANHAAVVGRLNDDHLFYLKSRGLTEKQSKALLVNGYLKPIALNFDEKIRNKIEKVIMEKCHV